MNQIEKAEEIIVRNDVLIDVGICIEKMDRPRYSYSNVFYCST